MDEYEIIALMEKAGGKLPRGYLPLGDDVSLIPAGKKKKGGGMVVAKCDMLVRETDVPKGMSYRDAARKAVVMCVSDFASKGARPDSFLISLGIPRTFSSEDITDLTLGFSDARREWGLKLVGGDTNESSDLVIDCVMLGFADRVVRRDGARPGQYVVVSGYFGYPPAGLKIIDGAEADEGFRRKALASVFRPVPRLKLGLPLSRYLESSMDSSDGLAICLHTIASMSGVGVSVTNLPVRSDLKEFAKRNGLSARELALHAGEEYEIVGTMEKSRFADAKRLARSLGQNLLVIGETTEERGVYMKRDGSRAEEIPNRGWTHLRHA